MKQFYVMEMNGFTEEESQRLFNEVFSKVEWSEKQNMVISHLTDKGIADLKKHVLKQEVTE